MLRTPGLVWLALASVMVTTSCSTGSKLSTPALTTDSRLHVADAAESSGDTETALSMYAAAASADPKSLKVQLRYARALSRLGRLDQARDVLHTALRETPEQPELRRELAAIDVLGGNFQQAATQFGQIVASAPQDVDALIDEGVALDLAGHAAEARRLYARALTLRPDDVSALNNMAMSFMLEGHFKDARNLLQKFADRDDIPTRFRNNLAIAYAGAGDMADARAVSRGQYSDEQLIQVVGALQRHRTAYVAPL